MSTQTRTVLPFELRPLPAPLAAAAAASAEAMVADGPGLPCRRCLRDAAPGDTMLLMSYDPWLGDGPYRQPGPIFVHDRTCSYDAGDELPEQLTRRVLSVRAFDERHRMTGCEVVLGAELAEAAGRLFGDRAAYLHVHFAGPGCFAVRVDRP